MKTNQLTQSSISSGKNVIITGGSSGIGLAIAEKIADRGCALFLLGRDPDRLQAAKTLLREKYPSQAVEVFPVDVSQAIPTQAVITQIGETFGGIQVLVCSAGILRYGKFENLSLEEIEENMRINYFGTVNVLKAAWPFLKASGGQIGLVGSVASYVGMIGYSAYAPGKYALAGLAECLRMEARDGGIGLTIIYPPDTDTPMLAYEHRGSLPETRAINKNAGVLSPEQVAERLLRGMEKGKFEVYCNAESRMIRVIKTIFPGFFFRQIDRTAERARLPSL